MAGLAATCRVAYISGEESVDQVRMRAARLGIASAPVRLAAATDMRDILASLGTGDGPEVVVVDSIQTMYVDSLDSAPGTVAPQPVSRATDVPGEMSRQPRATSQPPTPGIPRSVITSSNSWASIFSRASAPPEAVSTS